MSEDRPDGVPKDISKIMQQKECQKVCQTECHKICQVEGQKKCQTKVSEILPDRMPEDIPDRMPKDMRGRRLEGTLADMPESAPEGTSNKMSWWSSLKPEKLLMLIFPHVKSNQKLQKHRSNPHGLTYGAWCWWARPGKLGPAFRSIPRKALYLVLHLQTTQVISTSVKSKLLVNVQRWFCPESQRQQIMTSLRGDEEADWMTSAKRWALQWMVQLPGIYRCINIYETIWYMHIYKYICMMYLKPIQKKHLQITCIYYIIPLGV